MFRTFTITTLAGLTSAVKIETSKIDWSSAMGGGCFSLTEDFCAHTRRSNPEPKPEPIKPEPLCALVENFPIGRVGSNVDDTTRAISEGKNTANWTDCM